MNSDALDFLSGDGEMVARMRATDWGATALGPASEWPQNLKTCIRIILTSRQPMFVWWGDSLINLYNDAYRSIVGGKHPEVLGQPASVVWREIWDQIGPRAAQTMRNNEGTYDEALLLIMERNGYAEETYYTFSYSPVPNDRGGTGGIICANTDDTRRIIGERQLALLRELASRTADSRRIADAVDLAVRALETNPRDIPFALIYLFDPDRAHAVLAGTAGIERGHRAAAELVPLQPGSHWRLSEVARTNELRVIEDLRGRFGENLPKGAWPVPPVRAVALPIAASGRTGRAGALVIGLNRFRLFDDDYRGFLRLVAGQIGASIANAHAYEEEKKRAEALEELDRAKTAFFSNVSHEFRTPLTLMLGPLEEALGVEGGALLGDSLRTVHRNSLRLLKLVNTLLDFARIEAGRANATYQPTDLAALTADLASAFRSAVERAGLSYVVDCESLPEPVFVDHDMWEKIVLNLISNALKFTFEGSISVSVRWVDDHAELSVRDTGTGIPPEEMARLFERFHRVQKARARTHEGSGIGLALVHELVRLHGGSIRADSVVGRGTTFNVGIPRGHLHLAASQVDTRTSARPAGRGAALFLAEALRWFPDEVNADEPPPDVIATVSADLFARDLDAHILLADDNADMRDYLARLLRRRWSVETVGDGAAALAAARRRVPDLVVTDVMMPTLDGFGLLRALREGAETRNTPVIVLSARAGEESRVEGLQEGADDYLVKPFSARELVARVSTHLQLARLRRSAESERQRLYEFIMQAPVAVSVIHGPELRFELANPAYCEMVQRTELVGKRVRDVFAELSDHPGFAQLERVVATGKPLRTRETFVRLRRNGVLSDAYFDMAFTPVLDGSAAAGRRVIWVAVEITEQVLARKRVEALRAAAEQASRAKDEFLSTLSHELRTPLNAIVGWATLLRTGSVRAEQMPRVLETIDRNARVQARLIEDLLELSRIEHGKLVLSVGPVDMVRVVEAAVDAVRPAAEAKGVRIQPVLDSQATIVGDPDRLQQVVWNLLSNSIKFTPRGGRVRISLQGDSSNMELVVSDTGQGIEADFLPHVFDRFRQADPSYTRKAGGLGLGLAIVRSLVELHGGTVTASSEGAGRGATFVVQLPVAPLGADSFPRLRPTPSGAPQQRPFECPPELRGLRVLVVDDEAETRALLEYVIAEADAEVTVVSNARDALHAITERRFDVLVSDVGMPGEDGHWLIRAIRAMPEERGGRIPAVALTAYARSEDRTAAFRAGFDLHLPKPIDPGELLVVIARLISRDPTVASVVTAVSG